MRTSFKEIKEEVLSLYDELLETVKRSGYSEDDTSLKGLSNQAQKIREDRFCLLIAGEAKSGKSTFINAYLGTEILPMDVRQCTSAVVEIAYDEEFYLKTTYADDRVETIQGEVAINKFLKKNAALDDNYRDIPIPTINNEIIIKYKDRKICEREILDLLEGVKYENIHRLSEVQYNEKIRNYIKEKQECWKDIVIKIDIFYPFEDINMKGVRIIDSPGVNAAGKVGDITARYIESADSIMFLRPITGVAIEANSFKEFLESKSVDRNKNAMFLVLTRTASESPDTIARAYEEFVNMFGTMKSDTRNGIVKEQIIPIDSKAELYFNKFRGMETPEISNYIKQLREEEKAEPFLSLAWADAYSNKEHLQEKLKRISNFEVIDQALNKFGRKAQYIALSEFLDRVLKVYTKIAVNLKSKIENYSLKAEEPNKLAVKIKDIEDELVDIQNRLNEKVDEIEKKYSTSNGVIQQEAKKEITEFRDEIDKYDADNNESIEKLEKASFRKVENFIEFQDRLQKKIVGECNEALKVMLNDKNTIKYTELEPDFTPEVIEKIKEDLKNDAEELYEYKTGKTFKKTNTKPIFSQNKYYRLVSNSILEKLEDIQSKVVRELTSFVRETVSVYSMELKKNADHKRADLEKIKNDKKTAEELLTLINILKREVRFIEPSKKKVEELKGGIDGIV